MEPSTAATHRWVMHGVGQWFHRSHHRPGRTSGWERNDWFPVAFASIVMLGFWAGFNTSLVALVPLGIGVTLYGIAYVVVHDGYIHRRLHMFGSRRIAPLERLADAHRIHHLYNAAPYGMLAPIVPSELRDGPLPPIETPSHRSPDRCRPPRPDRSRILGGSIPWWIAERPLLDSCRSQRDKAIAFRPPSSSGLGHHPFKVAARVRIPLGVRRESVGHIWSRGEVRSSRRPVKPEVAGSNPVGTAAGGHSSSEDGGWLFRHEHRFRMPGPKPTRSSSSVGRAHA